MTVKQLISGTKKRRITMPKCTNCGKMEIAGNRNGMPNMIGFQLQTGEMINLCQRCLIKLGSMTTEQEKNEFIEGLEKRVRKND